jgi:signal peptidase I
MQKTYDEKYGGAPARVKKSPRLEPWYVDYSKAFFPVLLIVLLLRSFVAEPFRIPSGSMMPTLLHGDFILVNKFTYGLRLPVLHTKVFDNRLPQRGDVIVFRYPENTALDYIKRVVGIPGDRIEYRNKTLYINGEVCEQAPNGVFVGMGRDQSENRSRIIVEQLAQIEHAILINEQRSGYHSEGSWVVPEGHYFVLGDNRDNSRDSRFWGFVPEDHLVGKAFAIWMNWDFVSGTFDFKRIGKTIK